MPSSFLVASEARSALPCGNLESSDGAVLRLSALYGWDTATGVTPSPSMTGEGFERNG